MNDYTVSQSEITNLRTPYSIAKKEKRGNRALIFFVLVALIIIVGMFIGIHAIAQMQTGITAAFHAV